MSTLRQKIAGAMTIQPTGCSKLLLGLAWWAKVTLFAIAGLSCGPTDSRQRQEGQKISLGSTSIWKISLLNAAPFFHPKSMRGDWVMRTPDTALIIAGERASTDRRFTSGTIFAVETDSVLSDSLIDAHLILEQSGMPCKWRAVDMAPKIYNGRLGLRIRRFSLDGMLQMTSFYEPLPGRKVVKISVRITNLSPKKVAIVSGSEIWWDGGFAFSPGLGFVTSPRSSKVFWVGMKGRRTSSATTTRPNDATVSFSFDPHGPYGNRFIFTQSALEPGGAFNMEQYLVFGVGGLESIAEEAWRAAGRTVGWVEGEISPKQQWGEVSATSSEDGAPQLTMTADAQGGFRFPLPLGTYNIVLDTPGGETLEAISLTDARISLKLRLSVPKPGSLHFRVMNQALELLPGRLILRGIGGTGDPLLGPDYAAQGAANIWYTADGEGDIYLPVGKYRILATHGPEYSIDEKIVHISRNKGSNIKLFLERKVSSAGWVSADFHLHASPSPDSSVSLTDRVVSLLAENVEVAVATDHNVLTDYHHAVIELDALYDLLDIPGVEVTTWNPPWGHYNIWPIPDGAQPPAFTAQTPAAIFSDARERFPSSLIQVNHPRMDDNGIGYFTLGELDTANGAFLRPEASLDFDAIEIWNGMDLGKPEELERVINDWFALLNRGFRYTATGNSDSHYLVYQWAGYPRTYVRVADDDPGILQIEDFVGAVKAGRTFVTSGPFVVPQIDYALPGDLVSITDGEIDLVVNIQSPNWISVNTLEVIANGHVVHRQRVSLSKRGTFTVTHRMVLNRDSWVCVIVRGERSMDAVLPFSNAYPFAITSPIFVDIDGNGIFDAPESNENGGGQNQPLDL